MLPMHFRLIVQVFRDEGYKIELLETSGPRIMEMGQKYVHNDACYPAILVIGQVLDALENGGYDPDHVAILYFQTGGGCRASNYIALMRKAFVRAGCPQVPVISFSLMGVEKHPGFKTPIPVLKKILYGLIYGDLLLSLYHQCAPYEIEKGSAEALSRTWTEKIARRMQEGGGYSRNLETNMREMLSDFAAIPVTGEKRKQVGVVGEIYIKYAPLGNNNLVRLLMSEGAEVTQPGLFDFFLFFVRHHAEENRLYGGPGPQRLFLNVAYRYQLKLQNRVIAVIKAFGRFRAPSPFEQTVERIRPFMGLGCKMGEGWLLPAEMLELYENGIKNIICAQPFGCLPNHVCGRGMMKPLKDRYPDMNIVAVDYDPGATRVNQENRIKMMLSGA